MRGIPGSTVEGVRSEHAGCITSDGWVGALRTCEMHHTERGLRVIRGLLRLLLRLFGWLLLGRERVLARDSVVLRAKKLGLVAQPDRLLRNAQGQLVPYEKKSHAKKVYPNIRAQLGAIFLVLEEVYGERPAYGYAVLAGDKKFKVENTPKLRESVLKTLESIRRQREQLSTPTSIQPNPRKCAGCGFNSVCPRRYR